MLLCAVSSRIFFSTNTYCVLFLDNLRTSFVNTMIRATQHVFTHTSFQIDPPLLLETRQSPFCTFCFDEVCLRCTNRGEGVPNGEQVQIDGMPLCAAPPYGTTALSEGTTLAALTLDKGYYRTSNRSHDVHKCYNEDACVGGNDTEKYCASGYQGPCEDKVGETIPGLIFFFLNVETRFGFTLARSGFCIQG